MSTNNVQEVTVDAGSGNPEVLLSGGETVERLRVRVNSGYPRFELEDGAVLRNVAVVDPIDMPDGQMIHANCSSGGSALVENVWLGAGTQGVRNNGDTALRVSANHAGQATFRNIYMADMDTGCYFSGTGRSDVGSGGDTTIDGMYIENFGASSVLIGGQGQHTVRNLTIVNGNMGLWARGSTTASNCNVQANTAYRSGYDKQSENFRNATLTVQNCNADGEISTLANATIDGQIGQNPTLTPPSSVPTTPEEALNSTASGPSTSGTLSRSLSIENTSEDQPLQYLIAVSQSIEIASGGSGGTGDGTGTDGGTP